MLSNQISLDTDSHRGQMPIPQTGIRYERGWRQNTIFGFTQPRFPQRRAGNGNFRVTGGLNEVADMQVCGRRGNYLDSGAIFDENPL